MRFEKVSSAFAEIRQALDKVTVGYHEFKDALVVALVKQALGVRGGHVLVFGPTGTAKTRTTKSLARILGSVGIPVPYERVQGNPDTMPSDFLFRRTADYDDQGRLKFLWSLQKIGSFERKPGQVVLPGLFQFDELDKVTANGQFALLEAMEEQQVTVMDGRTVPLNFVLVATANTRKFDPTAKPLSRAVQDRFGAVVLLGYQGLEEDLEMLEQTTSSLREPEIKLNHFPAEELEELRKKVRESGLPLRVSKEMKQRIVTAVKLTQQKLDGYTDFTRYIKVPAGPRGILDLYWESGVSALLAGAGELTAEFPLSVGLRVLRGRVEVTPEAEIEGMTTDVVITKILAEVFGDATSGSRPFEQTSSGEGSTPEEEGAEKVEQGDEESKGGEEAPAESQPQTPSQSPAQQPPASAKATAGKQAGQGQQPWKDFPQPQAGNQSRQEPQAGQQPDWKKESFLASLRKEAQRSQSGQPQRDQTPKAQGKEGSSPKGTDQASPAGSQTSEDVHGGEHASGEVPDSPNAAQQGQQEAQSGQPSDRSGQEFGQQAGQQTGSQGQAGGSQTGGDSQAGQDSGSSGIGQQQGRAVSRGGESGGEGRDGQGKTKTVKTIASRQALAQWLAQQAAAERFRTTEGIKTGAEIAQALASGKQRFDFQSQDGKFKAHVRGEKAIAQGELEKIQQLARQEEAQGLGKATTGGAVAGKGPGYPTLDTFTLPPHITSILPMLREMRGEQVVEKLGDWINLPPNQKARTGAEYRLIKGFVHLAALQAVRNSEEVESSELTTSASGERVDFVSGRRDDLPLDEERTMLEALSQGGIVDDLSEVHEKRVRADAPQILFVLDGSGSMGYENRMMSAAVTAAACAQKYGPLGATFGLIAFTSNPALVVPMPETEVERVVDGIFSVSPGGGTSYATALELAFRHAPPRTTVVVLGDFIDSGQLSQEALALKSSKELKVVGIVSSAGNPSYASEICDETYLVGFDDPTSVALVAVKAAL
jgi:MoxR-like ATPase